MNALAEQAYSNAAALETVLAILGDSASYALVRKDNSEEIDVLIGPVVEVERIHQIPIPEFAHEGPKVLALVPFRQIAERGFPVHDDDAKLACIVVEQRLTIKVGSFVDDGPRLPLMAKDASYDLSDDQYGDMVSRIIQEEIGTGQGANFVIRRSLQATVQDWSPLVGLSVFRNLLEHERGAYWTFLVHTPASTLIGASPERHVSSVAGLVSMNPISGTFRYPAQGMPRSEIRTQLERFLTDEKEVLELMMVVDEELKMMSSICPSGGRVIGPLLKPMSHLMHTEYLLEGRSPLDVRDILLKSMFAATVVGSPVESACRVITKYEKTGRRYYGSVLAEIGYDSDGELTLDAPILIRTAEIDPCGSLTIGVGATLVRDSVPMDEVAETRAKVAGLLAALGMIGYNGRSGDSGIGDIVAHDDPLLLERNARLAPFWLAKQSVSQLGTFEGITAELVSAEDDFANMLAHQMEFLGVRVTMTNWRQIGPKWESRSNLLVAGPGPGDPRDSDDARIGTIRQIVRDRLASNRPLLGICLGHQILASEIGMLLRPRRNVLQGSQGLIDYFGRLETVGFYNTFTAIVPEASRIPYVKVSAVDDEVVALRGPNYSGFQFHAESILTPNGIDLLADAIRWAISRDFGDQISPGAMIE